MQFEISREALLKPLQIVTGVVERRQTLPVLSNVLMVLDGSELSLTGTDLEVELIGKTQVDQGSDGSITVPARKFLDICKSLPDGVLINVSLADSRLVVKSGRSRFTLATLPASEFPNVEEEPDTFTVNVSQPRIKSLLDDTSFAMAQQDVRYYLNGMLFEVAAEYFRVVATDGHRLAMETLNLSSDIGETKQLILPRKGVMELNRLLSSEDDQQIGLSFGQNHIRVQLGDVVFTSKLVDGKFPDYNRVLPKGGDKVVTADRETLRQAFSRASILSNEKYRGVRVVLEPGEMKIVANNPEQEEAEDTVQVEYDGEPLEIGFNVSYLIDVLATLATERARMTLSDPNSSALIESVDAQTGALYVVMPMRL